jgi:predicted nucleic acid-binding protein
VGLAAVGIVLDSTVLIAAERAGQNPRGVIEDLLAKMGDTEATLSIITVIELAHGIERANSTGTPDCARAFPQRAAE